jgi:hypothetical protein
MEDETKQESEPVAQESNEPEKIQSRINLLERKLSVLEQEKAKEKSKLLIYHFSIASAKSDYRGRRNSTDKVSLRRKSKTGNAYN